MEETTNARQAVCYYLCKAIQATDEGKQIASITSGSQHVFITYTSGHIKPIRIKGNNEFAMIKEVLSRI